MDLSRTTRPTRPQGLPEPPAAVVAPLSWRDRWLGFRNRLLASSAFQRGAAAFPLTRWVARRRARAVFDLVAGFVYSQVLLACVQLKVFETLAEGPQSLGDLARRCGLPEPAMERLLAAAASLQLLERYSQGRYGLGVLGAPLAGNRAILALIEHHPALYADLADPLALLRQGPDRGSGGVGWATCGVPGMAQYWPYAGAEEPQRLPPEQVAVYSALMTASQPLVADEILNAYPLQRHRCLLDIGGGEGEFLRRALARAPRLQAQLFDLPAVAARARQRLEAAGLADRATVFGGDFLQTPLPQGADLATLVRVVHDHDDARVLRLLKSAHAALAPDGTLLLAEPMADTAGAEPMGDAYFGFYLLAMGRGKPRTPEQLKALLHSAGFHQFRLLANPLPLQTRILLAKKRP